MNCPVEHILYDISWQNLILYTSATPQYDDEEVDDGVRNDINWDRFDASDENNQYFKHLSEYAR